MNRTVNFAGKSTRPASRWNQQVAKTSNSSIFLLLSFICLPFSTITAEALQLQKNSINHRVFHPPLIVLRQRASTSRQFPGDTTLIHATILHFVILGECRTMRGKHEWASQWVGKSAPHQHHNLWQGSHSVTSFLHVKNCYQWRNTWPNTWTGTTQRNHSSCLTSYTHWTVTFTHSKAETGTADLSSVNTQPYFHVQLVCSHNCLPACSRWSSY